MEIKDLTEKAVDIFGNPLVKVNVTTSKWGYGLTVFVESQALIFSDITSGCGAVIFSGYYHVMQYSKSTDILEKIVKLLALIFPYLKARGVGSIITTSGDKYVGQTTLLEKAGFKKLSTYPNYYHGSDYLQSLWQIIL